MHHLPARHRGGRHGTVLLILLVLFAAAMPAPSARGKEGRAASSPTDLATEYHLGSKRDIKLHAPDKHYDDFMVLAWSQAQHRMVKGFAHRSTKAPRKISAARLNKLPPGKVALIVLARRKGQDHPVKLVQRLNILPARRSQATSGPRSTRPTHAPEPPAHPAAVVAPQPPPTRPASKARPTTPPTGGAKKAPAPTSPASSASASTSASASIGGGNPPPPSAAHDRPSAASSPAPGPQRRSKLHPPAPRVQFGPGAPKTYKKGSGLALPLLVRGGVPKDAELIVRDQNLFSGLMVDKFEMRLPVAAAGKSQWKIPAEKLDLLPETGNRLTLELRRGGKSLARTQHLLRVTAAAKRRPRAPAAPPHVSFAKNAPKTYKKGSGLALPLLVQGGVPKDAELIVRDQNLFSGLMVDKFEMRLPAAATGKSQLKIPAEKLDMLPATGNRLTLELRRGGKTLLKTQHLLRVTSAGPTRPGTAPDGETTPSGDQGGPADHGEDPTPSSGSDPPTKPDPPASSGDSGQDPGQESAGPDPGTGPAQTGDRKTGPAAIPQTPSSFLGTNLAPANYWSTSWPWADAFRLANDWVNISDRGQPVRTDDHGWPIVNKQEKARTLMFWDYGEKHIPAGRWVITWDGPPARTADVSVGMRDATVLSTTHLSTGGGRLVFDVGPTNHGRMKIKVIGTEKNSTARDIHVWMPDPAHPGRSLEKSGKEFNPLFLKRLAPFSVIRFMDWMKTNNSKVIGWDQRTHPDQALTWGKHGVPIEYMIDLCNALTKRSGRPVNPWFCTPRQADDEYVRRFAQLVKKRLNPGSKVYLEWSNEVWNTNFARNGYIVNKDKKGKITGINHDRWARRMVQTASIFENVLGPDRVVRVLTGQAANVWQARQVAKRAAAFTKGTAAYPGFDAISCAAYIGLKTRDIPDDATADDILDMLETSLHEREIPFWKDHAALARQYHVPMISYEGGQHITPDGRSVAWYDAYVKAQRSDRMHDIYLEAMQAYEKAGGSLFNSFDFCRRIDKWGAWGQLEYQDQPIEEAPKYRAILEYPTSRKRLELSAMD